MHQLTHITTVKADSKNHSVCLQAIIVDLPGVSKNDNLPSTFHSGTLRIVEYYKTNVTFLSCCSTPIGISLKVLLDCPMLKAVASETTFLIKDPFLSLTASKAKFRR